MKRIMRIQVVRKRQRACFCAGGDRSKNVARLFDCLLARKRALADQNTDVIDTQFAERTTLGGRSNFVDLDNQCRKLRLADKLSSYHGVKHANSRAYTEGLRGAPSFLPAPVNATQQISPTLSASTLSSVCG